MQLTKIKIKNYRLLVNAELEVDPKTTLIVGRNNTAKTSCFSCIENVLKKEYSSPIVQSLSGHTPQLRTRFYAARHKRMF